LDSEEIEHFLHWLLLGASASWIHEFSGPFRKELAAIAEALIRFYSTGDNVEELFRRADALRGLAYEIGSPRQLLLADVACAIVRRRYSYSAWHCLPSTPIFQKILGVIRFEKQDSSVNPGLHNGS
jgi:hypothetical protein